MTKQQTITTLYKSTGLSLTKFAIRHGTIRQTMYKWLSGDRNICNKTLREIAKKEGYKLSIEYKLEKL